LQTSHEPRVSVASQLLEQKLSEAAASADPDETAMPANSQLSTFTLRCEMNFQLLLKFMERMKLPRSLSIFFCS
jgi:hypothetical protein